LTDRRVFEHLRRFVTENLRETHVEICMLRGLIVCLLIAALAFLAAWALPEGIAQRLLRILGSIVLMMVVFVGPISFLHWLSRGGSGSTSDIRRHENEPR